MSVGVTPAGSPRGMFSHRSRGIGSFQIRWRQSVDRRAGHGGRYRGAAGPRPSRSTGPGGGLAPDGDGPSELCLPVLGRNRHTLDDAMVSGLEGAGTQTPAGPPRLTTSPSP